MLTLSGLGQMDNTNLVFLPSSTVHWDSDPTPHTTERGTAAQASMAETPFEIVYQSACLAAIRSGKADCLASDKDHRATQHKHNETEHPTKSEQCQHYNLHHVLFEGCSLSYV